MPVLGNSKAMGQVRAGHSVLGQREDGERTASPLVGAGSCRPGVLLCSGPHSSPGAVCLAGPQPLWAQLNWPPLVPGRAPSCPQPHLERIINRKS